MNSTIKLEEQNKPSTCHTSFQTLGAEYSSGSSVQEKRRVTLHLLMILKHEKTGKQHN